MLNSGTLTALSVIEYEDIPSTLMLLGAPKDSAIKCAAYMSDIYGTMKNPPDIYLEQLMLCAQLLKKGYNLWDASCQYKFTLDPQLSSNKKMLLMHFSTPPYSQFILNCSDEKYIEMCIRIISMHINSVLDVSGFTWIFNDLLTVETLTQLHDIQTKFKMMPISKLLLRDVLDDFMDNTDTSIPEKNQIQLALKNLIQEIMLMPATSYNLRWDVLLSDENLEVSGRLRQIIYICRQGYSHVFVDSEANVAFCMEHFKWEVEGLQDFSQVIFDIRQARLSTNIPGVEMFSDLAPFIHELRKILVKCRANIVPVPPAFYAFPDVETLKAAADCYFCNKISLTEIDPAASLEYYVNLKNSFATAKPLTIQEADGLAFSFDRESFPSWGPKEFMLVETALKALPECKQYLKKGMVYQVKGKRLTGVEVYELNHICFQTKLPEKTLNGSILLVTFTQEFVGDAGSLTIYY